MKLRTVLLILLAIAPILMIDCTSENLSQPYFEQAAERIAAGEMSDLGYTSALRAPEYISQGWLKPIPDELVEEDFYPQLLEYFQRDGQTYALPHDFQTVALVVNGELFEKYGLMPPATWDELVETAMIIQEGERAEGNRDFFGLGLTVGLWNWAPFLFQAGGSPFDESGTKLTLDTPEAAKALTFYTDLSIRHKVALVVDGEWPELGAFDEILDAFAQERIAMFLGGPSMYDDLLDLMGLDASAQEKVRVVELPAGPAGRATIAAVRGYGLFRDAGTQADPALELLRFATSAEAMQLWIGDIKTEPDYVPARRSLQEAWLEAHPDTAAFMRGVDYLGFYQPATASFQAMEEFDRLDADVIGTALRGEIKVEEALQTLQEKGTAILK